MSIPKLVLYSRLDCCLCAEMKSLIGRVAERVVIDLTEVDIDSDDALRQRFGEEIPVLFIDGRKAAKIRTTEQALLRRSKVPRGWP